MTVKALMPVRNLNLVVPLAHKATVMRTTETAAPVQAWPGAVAPVIGHGLRQGDVHSTPTALTPGTRTSTTATRTTTTRAMPAGPEPSADPDLFALLVQAYLDCRRTKRNSASALAFEARLESNLGKSMDKLRKHAETMDAAALTTLLLDCAIVDGVRAHGGRNCGPLLNLASHYGVDAKAILAQASAPEPDKAISTPSPAGAGAKKAGAGAAAGKGKGKGAARAVMYRCPATGSTWSGKGLQPAWLKAALAQGKTLADFLTKPKPKTQDKEVKVDAGVAGEAGDERTEDLFEAAGA